MCPASQVVRSESAREFFVWVDPNAVSVQHNLALVGSFTGGRILVPIDGPEGLVFVPNPNHEAHERSLTPFHSGITRDYRVEYNLEVLRYTEFKEFPSRFNALFLLDSREEAERYGLAEPAHVDGRILKKGATKGPYAYTVHDSAWIKFLRLPHSIDSQTLDTVGRAYWEGRRISEVQLISMGKPWAAPSAMEVLFYGTIEFPNKKLTPD
jgi:hypothetical protein